jgi:3-phenylpropionate/cinnamic acid dioxygenase small subunit
VSPEELADRAAVLDVVAAYAYTLDTKDWTGFGALFTDDAAWVYEAMLGRLDGRTAIMTTISESLRPLDATQHLNGNHVVTVHGDEADHTCYFQAQHLRRGAPDGELYTAGGRYDDRLRRTPDGWRFTYRELTALWSQGNLGVFQP